MKTKSALTILAVIATLALVYEISFRICVRRWGEIGTNTEPASLYYSHFLLDKPLRVVFGPRVHLPFGKAYLQAGQKLYLKGGEFYIEQKDGSVLNLTELLQQPEDQATIEQLAAGDGSATPEP